MSPRTAAGRSLDFLQLLYRVHLDVAGEIKSYRAFGELAEIEAAAHVAAVLHGASRLYVIRLRQTIPATVGRREWVAETEVFSAEIFPAPSTLPASDAVQPTLFDPPVS